MNRNTKCFKKNEIRISTICENLNNNQQSKLGLCYFMLLPCLKGEEEWESFKRDKGALMNIYI